MQRETQSISIWRQWIRWASDGTAVARTPEGCGPRLNCGSRMGTWGGQGYDGLPFVT